MIINTNIDNINEELILIKNIFRKYLDDESLPKELFLEAKEDKCCVYVDITCDCNKILSKKYCFEIKSNEKVSKYVKRYAKVALYEYLSNITGYSAPWGALTGIRPTKLYYEEKKSGKNSKEIRDVFQKVYFVSEDKITQLERIIEQQSKIAYDYDSIDLYINIPFCTSKCYYCSFISLPLDKCKNLVKPYIEALIQDIDLTIKYLKDKGLKINTVYVGGGTPTSIGVDNLEKILKILPQNLKELTVEAGRPDTISVEMLDMLEKYNVTRISINPQTFSNDTLKLIGRNHSAEDVESVYNIARKYPFVINMDLIAGLGNEDFDIFKENIKKAILLNPDNITVHTLSIKRASDLNDIGGETSQTKEVEKMIQYSNKILLNNGYNPYYLYRQKNMLGNLENTGYCKEGTLCEFNVNSMEETLSVIACGANAISKCIDYSINRITRHANVKNIQEYIDRIDEMISKKIALFNEVF